MKEMLMVFSVVLFAVGVVLAIVTFAHELPPVPPTPQERYNDSVNAAHARLAKDEECGVLYAWAHDSTVSLGKRTDRLAAVLGLDGYNHRVVCYVDSATGKAKSREWE
jgi:hypothetical protein